MRMICRQQTIRFLLELAILVLGGVLTTLAQAQQTEVIALASGVSRLAGGGRYANIAAPPTLSTSRASSDFSVSAQ